MAIYSCYTFNKKIIFDRFLHPKILILKLRICFVCFQIFFLKLLGWKIEGKFPKLLKYVVAVVPHTSWVDFFVGFNGWSILGEKINFVGKKELFTPYFGWFFRLFRWNSNR